MSATSTDKLRPAVITQNDVPGLLDQILDRVDSLAIQQQRPSPVHLRTWEEIERFAEKAARSGMVPLAYKGVPDAIMIAVMLGAELGLAPMQSLQNIAVISGKPSIYGDAMIALVRASGKARSIREWSEGEGEAMVCCCEATRKDDPNPVLSRFGVADARKAGLWGKAGPWQQYPARMLKMRARGFALRDAFADVLHGVISAEEAGDIPFETTGLVPRVDSVDRVLPTAPVRGTSQDRTDSPPIERPFVHGRYPAATPAPKPAVEQPKRQTVSAWLDALALELAAAEGAEAVDAILARPRVQEAQDRLTTDAKDRLNHILAEAIARTAATETTAPNDEAHAGVFANPGEDPFYEPLSVPGAAAKP